MSFGETTGNGKESQKRLETHVNTKSPPDGGWGWVIVFAVFTGNCLMDGCIGSYGIFYPELLRTFNSGPVVTSLAGSLLPAVNMILSPLVGRINMKYGSRRVCFAGGCIGGLGLILASLANSMAMFMVTFGVILGIGISMNFLPGHVITNNYFDKKRGIAGGIVCSGAGFGIFILAPVLQLLLEEYGWRGTMLITAGFFMQLCACSTLLRPLCTNKETSKEDAFLLDKTQNDELTAMITNDFKEDLKLKNTRQRSDEELVGYCTEYSAKQDLINVNENCDKFKQRQMFNRITKSDRSASDDTLTVKHKNARRNLDIEYAIKSLQTIPSDTYTVKMDDFLRNSQFLHPVAVLAQSQLFEHEIETCLDLKHVNGPESRKCKSVICDISILRNKTFIPLLVGGVLIQMGQFIPNMFIPEYCFSIGLDGTQMSIIMAIYGAVNIFGRLSAGCFANFKNVDALWLCNIGVLMCGIGCVAFSLCTTFESLCIYAIGMGYFIGYFPPLQIIVMVECLGIDKLTSSLGLLQMAKGPAALFGPPLAGLVYQYGQDYAMSIGFAGILFLLAAGIQSLVPLANMCRRGRTNAQSNKDMEIIVD